MANSAPMPAKIKAMSVSFFSLTNLVDRELQTSDNSDELLAAKYSPPVASAIACSDSASSCARIKRPPKSTTSPRSDPNPTVKTRTP